MAQCQGGEACYNSVIQSLCLSGLMAVLHKCFLALPFTTLDEAGRLDGAGAG